jgi:hypothetical protein
MQELLNCQLTWWILAGPGARPEEARLLEAQRDTLPSLPTPAKLWQQAIVLLQTCRRIGRVPGTLGKSPGIAVVALKRRGCPLNRL